MGRGVSILDHVKALLAEKDVRDQQRFEAQSAAILAALVAAREATHAALTAAKEAVTKAETTTEKRLDGMNEFRRTLSDQARNFISKGEFDALKERIDRNEGRTSGVHDGWKWLLAVAALAIPVVLYFARTGQPT